MSGQPTPTIGFRRHLRAEVVPHDAVYLFSERGVTALQGPAIEALAPLLDGTRDLPAVLREMSCSAPPAQARAVLTRLARADLVRLRPRDEPEDREVLGYWDAMGLDGAAAGIRRRAVRVITVGDVAPDAAVAALRVAGVDPVPGPPAGGEDADLSVVLCDDYLNDGLAEIDRQHRAARRPWLLAKPGGARVWIGPVFGPGGPCWHCMAARLWGNRQAEAHVQSALGRTGHAPRPAVSVPPLGAAAVHLMALEVAKWLAGHRYPGQRSIWTLDSVDLQGRHHELRIRPQCAGCGDPDVTRAAATRPVRLESGRPPRWTPGELTDRYSHLVSPLTGVVREIRRDDRGPAFFNSFRSGPSPAPGRRGIAGLRAAQRMENGGKGTTAQQGEASALAEALERYSATWHGDEPRSQGTYRQLADRAVHPDRCQLYHPRQYEDRHRWNRENPPFQFVCDPFDEDAVIDWTPVWSLTRQRHRLLPTGLLYHGAPAGPGRIMVRADSNGNAAGPSRTAAVLGGLLELVERDAVALWWYNRTRHPAVDLDAFTDPWIEQLRQVYADVHREVWALDVTSDVGVPTVVALSRRVDKPGEDVMLGFGSHPDARTALVRALTEMNQLMPAVVDVGPSDDYGTTDPHAERWWRTATVATEPYLLPDPGRRPLTPTGHVPAGDLDPLHQVEAVRGTLEALGLEVLVLDQTRADIELPVAKVIVPGLRSLWMRAAPGRLYDVPVTLGRLPAPTPYDKLNPIPMFL